ncbi:uncharacterized protein UDID_00766 [Ustilago sp. UG-2017a]|nr:uncharacterized protein UDID_00766 [Ustilago sp. UG-2017a]
MPTPATFPYLAKATIKYKSPHKQDLTFAKGETIRVTGIAPKTDTTEEDDDDEDDDWLIGETLDGSRSGTFPGSFVEPSDEVDEKPSHAAEATIAEATAPPSAPGAIPSDAPTDHESSTIEESPAHQADTIPEAAREAAKKGETEEAGFGAPLPPRPPSPDADEAEALEGSEDAAQSEVKANDAAENTGSGSKPAVGAAAAGAVAATIAGVAAATTAGVAGVAAASSTESKPGTSTAAKSPPAIASKPPAMSSSFRDRLAAFNKPADSAPPPIPKARPGGWKRPTPAATETKPVPPSAPAASSPAASKPQPVTSPSTEATEPPTSTESSSGGGGAFSAADAQSSIKMSLKERMAALQRNEAAVNEAAAPQLKPKPSVPGKIGANRRNVALQGMGLAPGAAVPTRKSSAEASADTGDAAAAAGATTEPGIVDPEAAPTKADQAEDDAADTEGKDAAVDEGGEQAQEETDEPKEALIEEEQEAERRAAIAKRMAALGARRMGGAPVPFGAPAPPKRTGTSASIGSAEGTSSEPGISIPTESSASAAVEEAEEAAVTSPAATEDSEVRSNAGQDVAGEEPKILAVPRRTAAPRKKKPVPQAAGAGAGVAVLGDDVAAEESETAETTGGAEAEASHEVESEQTTSAAAVDADEVTPANEPADATKATQDNAGPTSALVSHEADGAHEATQQDTASDEAVEDDPEIAENQRQLEEYLRGEGFYEDQVGAAAPHDGAGAAVDDYAQAPGAAATGGVPPDDVTSPKPPSRPPSTRPPIPKTSLPPPPTSTEQDGAAIGRIASPPAAGSRRGSLIPPMPTTPLPVPVESTAEETEELQSSVAQAEDETETATGPVLAAPRPRMAIATEDPEDEELLAAADTAPAAAASAADETTEATTQAASQAEPEQQPQQEDELSEEEQEAQRRANLARRMAALGGQRIGAFPGMAPPPIMGAPMPVRKAAVQTEEAAEKQQQQQQQTPQGEGELSFVPRAKSPVAASVEAPVRLASPPPVPTSPPPKPMSPPPPARAVPAPGEAASPSSPVPPTLPGGRPMSTVPMANLDEAIRSASPANSSLGRRTSMKPPVPAGISASHSRDNSLVVEGEEEQRELATSPPPLPVSPPPLPVSPPPRPSSRAPPLPGSHGGVPPRRQGSSASYASHDLPPFPTTASPTVELPTSPIPARTESSHPPSPPSTAPAAGGSSVSIGARHSSRDLDLMPSSRWWRHGLNPLRLPPSVAGRPDAILYADTSSNPDPNTGVQVHKAEIFILFEDYSTTTISLFFQNDDLDETQTKLEQRHSFPPPKPSQADLKKWSANMGATVAKLASDAAKAGNGIGDGSSRTFIQHILAQTQALPPVGLSLGATVLTQVGPTCMESNDEPRPGDIVYCANADFKGKKGLAPYHALYGSQSDPLLAVVVEVEAKKNKLRCVTQGSGSKKGGAVEEISLRMDDFKSGIVKVYRVAPRVGWVKDW